ncbi:uncharacterized protein SPSK_09453 [Sporothrix schenckii 1099-18]|uniref:Uncharacterized protein n=2 Tax=Sporothrix schenckii TaxID=29908 RepID=U7Q777_SPOS1|nr:uncharacterized protein SPSK_09453 [Sporothrix schenckii 1099-18]ERT03052.1 hypothetical protein HMPREF1624_01357 [Sporothrix schenckii ATCC 58251]KJR84551.1 hypothetical protein SPSK_09453 [Sporothrix schenckii 1099-18]
MEETPRPITQDDLHATYVERSIRELQRAVQEEEGVLAELRRSVAGAAPLTSATASLSIMTSAYDAAARSDPFLPFADSVLPALLAMRKTHGVLAESQSYLGGEGATSSPALAEAQRRLALDKARLADQRALQKALEERIVALRSGVEARSTMTAEEKRQEALEKLRSKINEYDRDTAALLKSLKKFIQERLGPMLAAEELGGPVVGSMVDIQTDDLAAGFSSQGKLRKQPSGDKASKNGKGRHEDRRQRRIDEIWGPRGGAGGGGSSDEGEGDEGEDRSNWDEATAAAAEMQELTEELLNALADAGGDSSAAYVTILRESAAARFLVRSKVAQFHPRDATKLRLIDFGRELDD